MLEVISKLLKQHGISLQQHAPSTQDVIYGTWRKQTGRPLTISWSIQVADVAHEDASKHSTSRRDHACTDMYRCEGTKVIQCDAGLKGLMMQRVWSSSKHQSRSFGNILASSAKDQISDRVPHMRAQHHQCIKNCYACQCSYRCNSGSGADS